MALGYGGIRCIALGYGALHCFRKRVLARIMRLNQPAHLDALSSINYSCSPAVPLCRESLGVLGAGSLDLF